MSITRKHQNSTFSLFYCTYISMPLIIFFNTYIHVCDWLGCHMILILWQVKSSSSLYLLLYPLHLLLLIQHLTEGRKTKWKQYETKNIPLHLVNIKWQIGSTFLPPLLPFPSDTSSPRSHSELLLTKEGKNQDRKKKKKSKEREMGRPYLIFSEALNFSRCFKKMKMLFQLKILKM